MGRSRLPHPQRSHLTGLHLRPARPGDGAPARAMFYAAVHQGTTHAYTAVERAAWAPSPLPPPGWEAKLLAATTMVAEQHGQMAGFMTLGGDGHLDLAYVAPDRIGQGIGRALHAAILEAARIQELRLLDTGASLVARPFFAHLGWRQTARQSVIRNGVALTNFRMELTV